MELIQNNASAKKAGNSSIRSGCGLACALPSPRISSTIWTAPCMPEKTARAIKAADIQFHDWSDCRNRRRSQVVQAMASDDQPKRVSIARPHRGASTPREPPPRWPPHNLPCAIDNGRSGLARSIQLVFVGIDKQTDLDSRILEFLDPIAKSLSTANHIQAPSVRPVFQNEGHCTRSMKKSETYHFSVTAISRSNGFARSDNTSKSRSVMCRRSSRR